MGRNWLRLGHLVLQIARTIYLNCGYRIVMNEIVSPCVSVCELNEDTGFCLGCWRTRKEIAGWKHMQDNEKLALLDTLHQRNEELGGGKPRRPSRRRASAAE
jgi:hypothetical protein